MFESDKANWSGRQLSNQPPSRTAHRPAQESIRHLDLSPSYLAKLTALPVFCQLSPQGHSVL